MLPTCPVCRSALAFTQIRYTESFACPKCLHRLKLSRTHRQWLVCRTFLGSVVVLYLCGLRGFGLMLGAVLFWFPMLLIDMILVRPLFPPTLEKDEKRKFFSVGIGE